jgi:hypothetical protein
LVKFTQTPKEGKGGPPLRNTNMNSRCLCLFL